MYSAATVGAANEPVARRRLWGGTMGTAHAHVSGDSVDFVLDQVKGRDLDVGVHASGLASGPRHGWGFQR